MSYHFVTINNCCTRPLVSGFIPMFPTYSPFAFYHNPFAEYNMASQLLNGAFPSIFGFMNYTNPFNYNPVYAPLPNIGANYNLLNFNSLMDGMAPVRDYSADFANNAIGGIAPMSYDPTFLSSANTMEQLFVDSPEVVDNTEYKPIYTTFNRPELNQAFLNRVKEIAKNINCDYEDLLAVMNSESGLNPQAAHKNKSGHKTAVGLIQFTKNGAIAELNKQYGLDLTVDKISNMSAMEQLDLVEKYYKVTTKKFGGRKLTAADLYALTYVPAYATKDVLTRRGDGLYDGNEGLDENKDGIITKTDLNKHLAKKRVNLSTFA